jgi:hypothetical protein
MRTHVIPYFLHLPSSPMPHTRHSLRRWSLPFHPAAAPANRPAKRREEPSCPSPRPHPTGPMPVVVPPRGSGPRRSSSRRCPPTGPRRRKRRSRAGYLPRAAPRRPHTGRWPSRELLCTGARASPKLPQAPLRRSSARSSPSNGPPPSSSPPELVPSPSSSHRSRPLPRAPPRRPPCGG